jgi:hypothetical protein
MKRVLLLSICIVAGSALAAMAADNPAYAPNVTWTHTPKGGGAYQEVRVDLSSVNWPTAGQMTVLEGTWTATNGSFYLGTNADDAADWKSVTSAGGKGNSTIYESSSLGKQSYVNFPGIQGDALIWGRVGGTDDLYTSLGGSWSQGGTSSKNLYPGASASYNWLAKFYVTPGTQLTYTGKFGWVDGPYSGLNTIGTISEVPEPGMLVLLTTGLIGAVAMWVRRRRA